MDYQQYGELSPALDKSTTNGCSIKRDEVHRIETASPACATLVGRRQAIMLYQEALFACLKGQQMCPGLHRGQK